MANGNKIKLESIIVDAKLENVQMIGFKKNNHLKIIIKYWTIKKGFIVEKEKNFDFSINKNQWDQIKSFCKKNHKIKLILDKKNKKKYIIKEIVWNFDMSNDPQIITEI